MSSPPASDAALIARVVVSDDRHAFSELVRRHQSAVRATLRKLTTHTLQDIPRIIEIIDAARELGYAWASQECYLGDLTIGAPILGKGGLPVAAVNLSGPTSRWTLDELRARLAPLLLETARAASGRAAASLGV